MWAYNFIDDAFVRVEIEGQTGIAIQVIISRWRRRRGEGRTISRLEPERLFLLSLYERDPGGSPQGEAQGWNRQDLLTIVVCVVDVGSRRAQIRWGMPGSGKCCIVNQPQPLLGMTGHLWSTIDSFATIATHPKILKVNQPSYRAIGDAQSLVLWPKSRS